MKKSVIFFDFDGVIADSFAPALQAQQMICPAITAVQYRQLFQGNINDAHTMDVGHGPDCRHDIDFFETYLPTVKTQVRLFQGIDTVIARLSEKYVLSIISSSPSATIREFLTMHNLAHYFADILGNDVHKKKTEKIKMMLYRYDMKPDETLFITDTLGDLFEARHMQVAALGVSWGFNDILTLSKGNPWRIVQKPEDIVPAVADFFSRQK